MHARECVRVCAHVCACPPAHTKWVRVYRAILPRKWPPFSVAYPGIGFICHVDPAGSVPSDMEVSVRARFRARFRFRVRFRARARFRARFRIRVSVRARFRARIRVRVRVRVRGRVRVRARG